MGNGTALSAAVESESFDDLKAQGRSYGKSRLAFRTIGEVAVELDLAQHVLRFWESRFSHIRPLKRGGGRRYYRPEDIDQLRRIRALLYDDGYSIKGAQRLLKASRGRPPAVEIDLRAEPGTDQQPTTAIAPPTPTAKLDGGQRREMANILGELQNALEQLRQTP